MKGILRNAAAGAAIRMCVVSSPTAEGKSAESQFHEPDATHI